MPKQWQEHEKHPARIAKPDVFQTLKTDIFTDGLTSNFRTFSQTVDSWLITDILIIDNCGIDYIPVSPFLIE